jgi:hypothetical protein
MRPHGTNVYNHHAMKMIKSLLQKIIFEEKFTPLVFLFVAFAAFGLLANELGYYQDDWPYVFYAFNKGIPSLTEELFYDSRPHAAWLYISLFSILGFKPVVWHLAAVIIRWLTATVLWYFLRQIWPANKREVTLVIFIFIIHPFFLIQPYAVNSFLYWSGYLLFAISLLIMARNVTEPRYPILLTVLAIFLEAVHLFTSEYFIGMVFIRPLVLYWLIGREPAALFLRIKKTLLHWLPYLITACTYIIWRLFFYIPPPQGDRNSPVMLHEFIKDPVVTLIHLLETALQDAAIVTFTNWYEAFRPEILSFTGVFNSFLIATILVVLTAGFYYLSRNQATNTVSSPRWLASPFILGILIILLGMAPIWILGKNIVNHINPFAASRFGIGATLGAAMIMVVVIENIIDSRKKKLLIFSLLIALAVGRHLKNEKEFAYSWEKQVRFSQELIWRAPQLKPGTALFTDQEVLGMMGNYAVSFSINTNYQVGDVNTPPYWYFPFYYTYPDLNDLLQGTGLEYTKLSMAFSGNSKNMLLLSFTPEENRCLWVLSPRDVNLRLVSSDMRILSAGSNLSLIEQVEGTEPAPPEEIYGKTNTQTWCYFFEKADLARQFQEWEKITNLWEQAQSMDIQVNNGYEMIPFIEGYAHLEDWKTVKFLVKSADKITASLEPTLCPLLDELKDQAPSSADRDATIDDLKGHLRCNKFQ